MCRSEQVNEGHQTQVMQTITSAPRLVRLHERARPEYHGRSDIQDQTCKAPADSPGRYCP